MNICIDCGIETKEFSRCPVCFELVILTIVNRLKEQQKKQAGE